MFSAFFSWIAICHPGVEQYISSRLRVNRDIASWSEAVHFKPPSYRPPYLILE